MWVRSGEDDDLCENCTDRMELTSKLIHSSASRVEGGEGGWVGGLGEYVNLWRVMARFGDDECRNAREPKAEQSNRERSLLYALKGIASGGL